MKAQSAQLPTYSFYRRGCHSSHLNRLCYLSSTTEIRVIKFDEDGSITNCIALTIPQEPVKGIKIISSSQAEYFVGVAFITRFLVFQNEKIVYESNLTLDSNIVDFMKGYCGVGVYEHPEGQGKGMSFIFATRNGDLTIFNPILKNKVMKTPKKAPEASYEAFTVLYPNVYFTTDIGAVVCIQIESENGYYDEISRDESQIGLPLLELAVSQQTEQLYCCSCYGEIMIYSKDLSKKSVISAHQSMISRVLVSQDKLITFGEDCVMNIFEIAGERLLRLVESKVHSKLPSLLFKLESGNYVSFYENQKIQRI